MIAVKATVSKEFLALPERLRGLDTVTQTVVRVGALRSAKKLVLMVREAIETQSLRLARLSDSWKTYKRRNNLDPRKLIASKDYLNSIRVGVGERGYVVGTDKLYGLVHEYGFGNIPARPHWRPTIRRWSRTAAAPVGEYAKKALSEYLYKGTLPKGEALDLVRPTARVTPRRPTAVSKKIKALTTAKRASKEKASTAGRGRGRAPGGRADTDLVEQMIKSAVRKLTGGKRGR